MSQRPVSLFEALQNGGGNSGFGLGGQAPLQFGAEGVMSSVLSGMPGMNSVAQLAQQQQEGMATQSKKAQEAAQAQADEDFSPDKIAAMISDYQQQVALSKAQQVMMGFAEGQMQSPYAGNRVFGASIAGTLGAKQKDVQNKMSIQAQLVQYAQNMIDMKRKRIELDSAKIEGQYAKPLIEARMKAYASEADSRVLSNTKAKMDIERAPTVYAQQDREFESDIEWKRLRQNQMKLEDEAAALKRQWELEDRPAHKAILQRSLEKATIELQYYDDQLRAKIERDKASASNQTSLANKRDKGKIPGGGIRNPFSSSTF